MTYTFKHTKGPWEAVRAESALAGHGWFINAPDGRVALVIRVDESARTRPDAERLADQDADAALIAAAPEMAELLRDIVSGEAVKNCNIPERARALLDRFAEKAGVGNEQAT